MLNKINKLFQPNNYIRTVGTKTNIHKVSYFFKPDILDLHSKRILFLDFEFSMNKIISEVGGFILENNKIVENIFNEYSLPPGEPYWDFFTEGFITEKLNPGKPKFSKKDSELLIELLDSVDYIVVHNYVAEAQCLLKILFPQQKYNIQNLKYFTQGKFICTNYSFKNKYFKSLGMTSFTNSDVSSFFGWKVKDKGDKLKIVNKSANMSFYMNKPSGVNSQLHNSFYDSVITFTNFISMKKIYF